MRGTKCSGPNSWLEAGMRACGESSLICKCSDNYSTRWCGSSEPLRASNLSRLGEFWQPMRAEMPLLTEILMEIHKILTLHTWKSPFCCPRLFYRSFWKSCAPTVCLFQAQRTESPALELPNRASTTIASGGMHYHWCCNSMNLWSLCTVFHSLQPNETNKAQELRRKIGLVLQFTGLTQTTWFEENGLSSANNCILL